MRVGCLLAVVLAQVLTALTIEAAEFTPLGYYGQPLGISADGGILLLYTNFEYSLLEDGVLTPVSSLPGFPADATAVDMSANGQVIAGNSDDGGFIWSGGVATHLTADGTGSVSALSGDGTTVAGWKGGALFSWRAGTFTTLPSIVDEGDPGAELDAERVHDISHDGSVVVGSNMMTPNRCFQCTWAVRWEDGVLTRLDDLLGPPAPDPDVSELIAAFSVSDDGQVIVGSTRGSSIEPHHFRVDHRRRCARRGACSPMPIPRSSWRRRVSLLAPPITPRSPAHVHGQGLGPVRTFHSRIES